MSQKVIASIGAGAQRDLLRLASRSFGPYARRHGYDLCLRDEATANGRPLPWAKVPLLRELVTRYAVVVWIDADAVIVDQATDIATELVAGSMLHLVEHVVGGEPRPNTGVMMLRGGEEAVAFLDAVWALEHHRDHRWWENAAVCELLGYGVDPPARLAPTPWRERTAFLPGGWNWIRDAPVPAPHIRHFPGFALRTRRALMWAALAESRLRGRPLLGSSASSPARSSSPGVR